MPTKVFLVLEQNLDPKKKGASTVCASKVLKCQMTFLRHLRVAEEGTHVLED